MTRFPISFDTVYRVLSSFLLLPPSASYIDVGPAEISVRMGWAFRSVFPRAAVASAPESGSRPLCRGVHGFAGRWLVNGSARGIVDITVSPPQRAYVVDFPIRLRRLLVSVDEPLAFTSALSSAA